MIMTTSSEALGRKDVHELSATSGSPSSRAEVGLSELSGHDYEDLKAFNEKRLWFEQRLKLLEQLPPIYPFAPYDESDSSNTPSQSQQNDGRAPSIQHLADLQKQRDELEDEVLLFDGGDLARMKEKTRVVTQAPLTPPSTELVSLTLALIVVIDRLLAMLRQRSEVIELCRLRLEWESIQSLAFDELSKITHGIGLFADEYRTWIPGQVEESIGRASSEKIMSKAHEGCLDPIGPASATSRSTIRDRLISLQNRLNQLAKTDVARTGRLLDCMIDIAAGLKGCETYQTTPQETGQGAVPTLLLDRQDELEERQSRLLQQLGLCRSMEQSWSSTEKVYERIIQARNETTGVFAALRSMPLDLPDNSRALVDLRDRIEQAQGLLHGQWETPRLPLGLRVDLDDDHERRVDQVLHEAQGSARKGLRDCQATIDWFQRYHPSRQALLEHGVDLQSHKAQLLELMGTLSNPTMTYPPFTDHRLEAAEAYLTAERSTARHKKATIVVGKYRAIARSMPEDSRAYVAHESENLASDVGELLAETVVLEDKLAGRCQTLNQLHRLQQLLVDTTNRAESLSSDACDLGEEVRRAIDASLWSSAGQASYLDSTALWQGRLEATSQAFESGLIADIRAIDAQASSVASYDFQRVTHVRQLVETLQQKLCEVQRLHSLFIRVREQSAIVHTIQHEADDLLDRIRTAAKTATADLALHQSIRDWESGITDRVLFVEMYASSQMRPSQTKLAYDVEELWTPPPSPPLSDIEVPPRWDLAAVDRAVREEINKQTARVRSLLEHSPTSAESPEPVAGQAMSDDAIGLPITHQITKPRIDTIITPETQRGESNLRSTASSASEPVSPSRTTAVSRSGSSSRSVRSISGSQSNRSLLKSLSRHSLDTMPAASPHRRQVSQGAAVTPARSKVKSTPRKYVPKVDNQLDQAVGKIVNSLDVHVPIAPVSNREANDWTDETGSYWIGAEGRAKLCFCRILRSQTVMVRVGGGWVELSKFLADHFAESIVTPETAVSSSTSVTPDRQPVGRLEETDPISTPRLKGHKTNLSTSSSINSLSRSTSSMQPLSLGPGSPLTPLRFMRKASDSPDDRKKEKDKLKVGRRSILGKEA